ncbi:hypothetical protein Tco_1418404 [Tanacetum coccineum]
MVWSGYAVLMSGKTDSITKLNNIPGCLPGSTFVYSEVFKLDFSSASLSLMKSSLFSILHLLSWLSCGGVASSILLLSVYWNAVD